jgi:LysR family carnitine catabolism transcriptional activator
MPSDLKPRPAIRDVGSMGIDLVQLETFVAVAELGSFSLAAQQLHVSQPTITGRVQRLEAALGTKLLVRTTRRVETTAEGATLLADAAAALSGLRRSVLKLREQGRLASRRVIVASTPMLAATRLPPIIRDYGQRYTDVQVKLLDLRYAEALAAVAAGNADMAVLAFEGRDMRFQVQALSTEDMVLVVPATHALAGFQSVTFEQIAPWPLLLIEQYESLWARVAEDVTRSGVTMAPTTIVGNLNTMLGMLDADLGATLLPRSIALGRRTSHAVIEIAGSKLVRTFSLVRARKVKPGTAAQSFIRFLRQAMAHPLGSQVPPP